MANNFLRIKNGITLEALDTAPTSPQAGDIYYDTTVEKIQMHNGSAWESVVVNATGNIYQEYADLAAFPATGASGVLYLALDTAKLYRWDGAAYSEVSAGSSGSYLPLAGGTMSGDIVFADGVRANFTVDDGVSLTETTYIEKNKVLVESYNSAVGAEETYTSQILPDGISTASQDHALNRDAQVLIGSGTIEVFERDWDATPANEVRIRLVPNKSGTESSYLVPASVLVSDNSTGTLKPLAIKASEVSMESAKIINVADPTLAQDAATKAYIDGEVTTLENEDLTFLKLDGTRPMSGNLDMGGFGIDNASGVNALAGSFTNFVQIATATIAEDMSSPNNLGISWPLIVQGSVKATQGFDATGFAVSNVADPVGAQDAATMNYVDGAITTALTGYATETYADTAAGNATTSANSYTDTAVSGKVDTSGDAMSGTLRIGSMDYNASTAPSSAIAANTTTTLWSFPTNTSSVPSLWLDYAILRNGVVEAGTYIVAWNGTSLSEGGYSIGNSVGCTISSAHSAGTITVSINVDNSNPFSATVRMHARNMSGESV